MHALVVALNPSVDVEWRVDTVRPEEKNEVLAERRWPGGKGVNVARWLNHLGHPTRLLLPLGGLTGREFHAALRREQLAARVVPVHPPTRANIIVTPVKGPQFRFNPVWYRLPPADWRQVRSALETELASGQWVVLSGSLPRGAPAGAYGDLVRAARRVRARCVVDCDGPPLAAALHARPFLVKPNEAELGAWAGRPLRTRSDVLRAAWTMSELTKGWVLVSRGARGAMLVHAPTPACWMAQAPKVKVRNTVGAGDALVAGVVSQMARQAGPEAWLRWGVAAGSAAASCRAGQLPTSAAVRRLARAVTLRALSRARDFTGVPLGGD